MPTNQPNLVPTCLSEWGFDLKQRFTHGTNSGGGGGYPGSPEPPPGPVSGSMFDGLANKPRRCSAHSVRGRHPIELVSVNQSGTVKSGRMTAMQDSSRSGSREGGEIDQGGLAGAGVFRSSALKPGTIEASVQMQMVHNRIRIGRFFIAVSLGSLFPLCIFANC